MENVISRRRPLIMLTADLEIRRLGNFLEDFRQLFPISGINNRLPEAFQKPVREHIVARAEQEGRRLEVDVEAGAFHPGSGSFPKIEAQVGFVRCFIQAETGIPVKTENGFIDFGNSHDVGRNLFQPAAQGYDESLGGLEDIILVDFMVGFKPLPVVVSLECPEKGDRLLAESLETGLL